MVLESLTLNRILNKGPQNIVIFLPGTFLSRKKNTLLFKGESRMNLVKIR